MVDSYESAWRENLLSAIGASRIRVIRVTNYYLCIAYGIAGVGAGIGIGFWIWA